MKNLISQEEMSDIYALCLKHGIQNFSINSDGSIDVRGDVNLRAESLDWLPIKFNVVDGFFDVSNNKIYDFHNFPKEVKGDLLVMVNYFTSLEGFDTKVGGSIMFSNNRLQSVKGLPNEIHGSLDLSENSIVFLDGIPNIIHGYLDISSNYIQTLKVFPQQIDGSINVSYNKITTLEGLPKKHDHSVYFNGTNITSLDHLPQLPNDFGLELYNLSKLDSTYCGDIDPPSVRTSPRQIMFSAKFPKLFGENIDHISLIMKYQRHFEIWNPDLSFNEENFLDLMEEIKDGLQ